MSTRRTNLTLHAATTAFSFLDELTARLFLLKKEGRGREFAA